MKGTKKNTELKEKNTELMEQELTFEEFFNKR